MYLWILYLGRWATSFKLLTYLETIYIKNLTLAIYIIFFFFLENASSSQVYKHTDHAKQKMVKRLQDKSNHPFWGKHHYEKTKSLISKAGLLNPMFGETHSEESKTIWEVEK